MYEITVHSSLLWCSTSSVALFWDCSAALSFFLSGVSVRHGNIPLHFKEDATDRSLETTAYSFVLTCHDSHHTAKRVKQTYMCSTYYICSIHVLYDKENHIPDDKPNLQHSKENKANSRSSLWRRKDNLIPSAADTGTAARCLRTLKGTLGFRKGTYRSGNPEVNYGPVNICKSESCLVYRRTNRQFPSPREHISVGQKELLCIYDLACRIELSVMLRIPRALESMRERVSVRKQE